MQAAQPAGCADDMKTVPVKTYYLEMCAPPACLTAAPRNDLAVVRRVEPQAGWYRSLYRAVGGPWRWYDRAQMPDEQLAPLIQHPAVEIYVLLSAQAEAGFAELDCRQQGEIELLYFGLVPACTGQRLGSYYLQRVLQLAWSHQPRRVWLHTCEWDHPAAVALYRKAGFVPYAEGWVDQVVPDDYAG